MKVETSDGTEEGKTKEEKIEFEKMQLFHSKEHWLLSIDK